MAYKFNEPFLLVGDTGIGKTTICQILALINNKHLNIINCHMHSEADDFFGSIRPVRATDASSSPSDTTSTQLFEWQDGPLVVALRDGQDFLIDEISLADDSVLERLNSVLEEERTLLVAGNASSNSSLLVAHPNFRIFSTMNPGGDFGKKELSAALRNRFTEIWCPTPSHDSHEFQIICSEKLNILLTPSCQAHAPSITPLLKTICKETMIAFLRWLSSSNYSLRNRSPPAQSPSET
jgi:midasin